MLISTWKFIALAIGISKGWGGMRGGDVKNP